METKDEDNINEQQGIEVTAESSSPAKLEVVATKEDPGIKGKEVPLAIKELDRQVARARLAKYKPGTPQESMRVALLTAERLLRSYAKGIEVIATENAKLKRDVTQLTSITEVTQQNNITAMAPKSKDEWIGGDETCEHRFIQMVISQDNEHWFQCATCGSNTAKKKHGEAQVTEKPIEQHVAELQESIEAAAIGEDSETF